MPRQRQRLLASGLALTWLIVWLQVFLPFLVPADPLNPGRHILGDTAIICTVEGMKIVKLADLPLEPDGKSGKTAGAGSHACPLCAAMATAAATLLPATIDIPQPPRTPVARIAVVSIQPRVPPAAAAFSARAPPSLT